MKLSKFSWWCWFDSFLFCCNVMEECHRYFDLDRRRRDAPRHIRRRRRDAPRHFRKAFQTTD